MEQQKQLFKLYNRCAAIMAKLGHRNEVLDRSLRQAAELGRQGKDPSEFLKVSRRVLDNFLLERKLPAKAASWKRLAAENEGGSGINTSMDKSIWIDLIKERIAQYFGGEHGSDSVYGHSADTWLQIEGKGGKSYVGVEGSTPRIEVQVKKEEAILAAVDKESSIPVDFEVSGTWIWVSYTTHGGEKPAEQLAFEVPFKFDSQGVFKVEIMDVESPDIMDVGFYGPFDAVEVYQDKLNAMAIKKIKSAGYKIISAGENIDPALFQQKPVKGS